MKFKSKYETFHPRKCICEYRLRNGGHVVRGGGWGFKSTITHLTQNTTSTNHMHNSWDMWIFHKFVRGFVNEVGKVFPWKILTQMKIYFSSKTGRNPLFSTCTFANYVCLYTTIDKNSHRNRWWFGGKMTHVFIMMTSLSRNIFRVIGPLCGEFTRHRLMPSTKASDAELWCFLWSAPNERLSKLSWGWWFETLWRPLWRHCNVGCESIVHQVRSLGMGR